MLTVQLLTHQKGSWTSDNRDSNKQVGRNEMTGSASERLTDLSWAVMTTCPGARAVQQVYKTPLPHLHRNPQMFADWFSRWVHRFSSGRSRHLLARPGPRFGQVQSGCPEKSDFTNMGMCQNSGLVSRMISNVSATQKSTSGQGSSIRVKGPSCIYVHYGGSGAFLSLESGAAMLSIYVGKQRTLLTPAHLGI